MSERDERRRAVKRAVLDEGLETLEQAAQRVGLNYVHFTGIVKHGIPRRAHPKTVARLKKLPRVYAALLKYPA